MTESHDATSEWAVSLEEISAGVYRIRALHPSGPRVELEGTDPEDLLKRCNQAIEDIAKKIVIPCPCPPQELNPRVQEREDGKETPTEEPPEAE